MANRRQLKKSVNLICGELFADCVALGMCGNAQAEQLDAIMTEVLDLRCDFVARISHVDKANTKTYFTKLREDFTDRVNALSDRIVSL